MPPFYFVLVGCGEIAKKQHIPILQGRSDFFLRAIVDVAPTTGSPEVPVFATVTEALEVFPDINAAVLCTPPQFTLEYIRQTLNSGLHVFVEKPPGRDHEALAECEALAYQRGVTLFTAYHSTASPAMGPAKEWIKQHWPVVDVTIQWKEAANKWHRGQVWVTRAEGYGVLDAVLNALSIVDELLLENGPDTIMHVKSHLLVPRNWGSPIAGETTLRCGDCVITAHYDWNYTEGEVWTIGFTGADGAQMELVDGGAQMYVGGQEVTGHDKQDDVLRPEYEELYRRFVELVHCHKSEIRPTPLRLINQILQSGTFEETEDYSIFG